MPTSSGSRAETDAPQARTDAGSFDVPPDDDISAAKRMALGLTPRRPTAKAIPQRPPSVDVLPSSTRRWLPALLIGISALTALLIIIKLQSASQVTADVPDDMSIGMGSHSSTDSTSSRSGQGAGDSEPDMLAGPMADGVFQFRMVLSDSFDSDQSVLIEGDEPGGWHIELVPMSGIYRMDVCCKRIAYSLPAIQRLGPHRIQAGAQVRADTPWGFVGLIERYGAGDEDFYMFSIDGQARYQIEIYQDGQSRTLQSWTKSSALNPAGNINVVAVEDLGSTLRFFGNNILLHEVTTVELEPGGAGLVGGSMADETAEMQFDWFQLFDLVPAEASATATPDG
jgi:hypothetical protein